MLEQFRVIPLGADLWQTMWRRPGADLLVTQNPLIGALGSHPVNLFTMILCRTSAPTWAVLRFQLRRVVAEVLPGSPHRDRVEAASTAVAAAAGTLDSTGWRVP